MTNKKRKMTSKEIIRLVVALYRKFLADNGVTHETVNANVLWKWPEYLAKNKTW